MTKIEILAEYHRYAEEKSGGHWVTLENDQRVFIDGNGTLQPSGPQKKITPSSEGTKKPGFMKHASPEKASEKNEGTHDKGQALAEDGPKKLLEVIRGNPSAGQPHKAKIEVNGKTRTVTMAELYPISAKLHAATNAELAKSKPKEEPEKSKSPEPAAKKTPQKTANYKGREYTLLFVGNTKFGRRANLQFKDGSKDFWVDASAIEGGGGKSSEEKIKELERKSDFLSDNGQHAASEAVDRKIEFLRNKGKRYYAMDTGENINYA